MLKMLWINDMIKRLYGLFRNIIMRCNFNNIFFKKFI